MPPHVDMGGHHIVLLKTVANETHTTIPKRKLKTNKTEQDIDLLEQKCLSSKLLLCMFAFDLAMIFLNYLLPPTDPNGIYESTCWIVLGR